MSDWQKILIGAALLAVVGYACFSYGRNTASTNNDNARVQQITESIARIEGHQRNLDARLDRIDKGIIAGEKSTQSIISGIGEALGAVERLEGRYVDRARNLQAAQDRIGQLEDIFREIYQREQAKKQ